jgi:uncharacterized membrane protein
MKPAFIALTALLLATAPDVLAQATGLDCVARQYDVVALPLRPTHINETGQVAGTTSQHRASLWNKQKGLREVPLPPGFFNSEAAGVNRSGHLTGTAYDRSSTKHRAFEFSEDKFSLLEGEQVVARGINDSGEIAGEAIIPGKGTTGPALWTEKGVISLGGCCGGAATGLNNHGQVIGDVYDKAGSYTAFLWDANHGLQMIGPPNRYSSAIAVNDSGHVLIQAFSEAYLYSDGKLTQLDLSPQNPSQPRAINNCDVVVGSFGPFADANRAFVWEKSHGFRDLNNLISPGSGWKLEAAAGINDHGDIVGWGDYKGEDDTGFLLVPKP